MGPNATSAELEFAAMYGPLSRVAIPIGLVWPKQSHVLLIAGGPTFLLSGTDDAAPDQKHEPSHVRFAHLLEDDKTVVPETQPLFVPEPGQRSPVTFDLRVTRVR